MATANRLLLSGGVGGARLCDGFYRETGGDGLTIAVNTGDDFEHLGLHISPDIDSVLYTLSGQSDPERGWGLRDERWSVLARLGELDGPTWFQLGDRDLATHLLRTAQLGSGATLSEAVESLARAMGVSAAVVPMSNEPVRTYVQTTGDTLPFQEYFVRERCAPVVRGFEYQGAECATPAPELAAALHDSDLRQIVICPSNPFVSVAPILAVPTLLESIKACSAPVLAVSPILGNRAVKGPAAAMLEQLGYPVSAVGVARYYAQCAPGLLNSLVIHEDDSSLVDEIEDLGMRCLTTDILMPSLADRQRLARWLMAV